MSLFPSEILYHVFSYFDSPVDLEHCVNVNRLWNRIGNSTVLWRAMAVKKYGESVADTTVHMYSNSWKDLLHDDNRQGAFPVLNINKPCYWLKNGESNRYYCCIVVSLIWDRRSSSEEGVGGLYLAIDARGEWDLRNPIRSSIKCCSQSADDVVNNLPAKWISKIEHREFGGHYKGLLLYPIRNDHDLQTNFFGDLYFTYANPSHPVLHYGDYDSIKIVEGNLNSMIWDSYTTYDQMMTAQESEEIDQKRWEGVFPSERQPMPRSVIIRRAHFPMNGNIER